MLILNTVGVYQISFKCVSLGFLVTFGGRGVLGKN